METRTSGCRATALDAAADAAPLETAAGNAGGAQALRCLLDEITAAMAHYGA